MSYDGFPQRGGRGYDMTNNVLKRGRRNLTAQQRYEIQVKRGQGMTPKEIALEYNITANYVYQLSPVYL